MRFGLAVLGMSVLACGCVKTVDVDGFTVPALYWEQESATVAARAAYDLECPKDDVHLTIVTVTRTVPNTVAAEGCGKRALYVHPTGALTWIMDGGVTQSPG